MELPLYERVALRIDVPDKGLKKGDIVTTVEFLEARRDLPNAYVVEVFNAVGDTIAVLTVPETDLKVLTEHDVLQVRYNLPPAEQIIILDEGTVVEVEAAVPLATDSNIITIELSDELLEQKGATRADLKLQLALFLFQQEFFSLGKASEFSGLHPVQFQKELAKRHVTVHYDTDDYQKDVKLLDSRQNFSSAYQHA